MSCCTRPGHLAAKMMVSEMTKSGTSGIPWWQELGEQCSVRAMFLTLPAVDGRASEKVLEHLADVKSELFSTYNIKIICEKRVL